MECVPAITLKADVLLQDVAKRGGVGSCAYALQYPAMGQLIDTKTKVAVFDFDHTCIEGSSPFTLVRRLTADHRLSPITTAKISAWGIRYKLRLPHSQSWVRSQVFKAFDGMPKETADEYMRTFYDNYIEPRFRPAAHRAMLDHKEAGHEVIVVSASFEPIVMRAMELHPFDAQVSTRMEVNADGTYSREVEGKPVEGDEKLAAIRRICDERYGVGGWHVVAAYGDHHTDAPMLAFADHAYAVNPNGKLEHMAKERNWPILDWSRAV